MPAEVPEEFLLWVGTTEPRKNLTKLVAAHNRLPKAPPLVLVGPKGWAEAPNSDRVIQLGEVDKPTLMALYQKAQAFVFPSHSEGFGLPILEAFAAGTPVLTSNKSACAEVASDAAVLVDPNSVADITKGISRLIDDRRLREHLSDAGLDRAVGFSWQATTSSYVEVFKSLL